MVGRGLRPTNAFAQVLLNSQAALSPLRPISPQKRLTTIVRACLAAAAAMLALGGSANATEAHYTCSGGTKLTAQFSPPSAAQESAALTFDTGRRLTLPQALSADGGRYASAGVEFWIKGRSATLTMRGVKRTCSTR
jgi:membrane-bound inhibitor of C-type lysozyme